MSLKNDLFISYTHIDNQPLPQQEEGWLDVFHEYLKVILDTRIGRKTEIWRDDKLRKNDKFGAEIIDQFSKTALFLSVVSPRYFNSEWCFKEVDDLCSVLNDFAIGRFDDWR